MGKNNTGKRVNKAEANKKAAQKAAKELTKSRLNLSPPHLSKQVTATKNCTKLNPKVTGTYDIPPSP